jgi:hypothetical protein
MGHGPSRLRARARRRCKEKGQEQEDFGKTLAVLSIRQMGIDVTPTAGNCNAGRFVVMFALCFGY